MSTGWLLFGIFMTFLFNLGYETYKDKRARGEWIWQTWQRERRGR